MKERLIHILIFIFGVSCIFYGTLFAIPINAYAVDKVFFRKVINVIDGDTIKIDSTQESELINYLEYSVRIRSIDAPEIHTKSNCEKKLGLKAKKFLESIVKNNQLVKIINPTWDKYGGRILAELQINDQSISQLMIDNKHAVAYFGQKKEVIWCTD